MTEERIDIDYSVLMSIYAKDNPTYLNDAIASMIRQTVPFHDMVIVCDGPLDVELEQQIESWKAGLGNRLTIVKLPENLGLGAALNKGLPVCACNTVVRMDADDISRAERCEILLAAMAVSDLDIVGGAIEEFDKRPGDMGVIRKPPITGYEIREYAKRRNPLNHMTVMFKKGAVENAGGYQAFYLLEDYWLWIRMLNNGAKMGNVADVVMDVRTGSGMYARRASIRYLESQVSFFNTLYDMRFISGFERARAVIERSVATILPKRILKVAYNALLRVRLAR